MLISEPMKKFHNLQSSEQNLYKELAALDSFNRSSEAALNEKIEGYGARSDVEHRLHQQIAVLEASCEASETSLCNENKKLRQENGEPVSEVSFEDASHRHKLPCRVG